MTPTDIPSCQVEGALVAYAGKYVSIAALVTGAQYAEAAAALIRSGARPVARGALRLRLGVALYGPPFLFLPTMIVDEAGAIFRGEAALDWLRASAYEMPRAQVFGLDAQGKEDMIFARDVDVESSLIVVGGPDRALVRVATCVGAVDWPPRFAVAVRACPSADPQAVRATTEAA